MFHNKKVFKLKTNEEKAAIKIQKVFRGYLGRKIYMKMEEEAFDEEERKFREKEEQRIKEWNQYQNAQNIINEFELEKPYLLKQIQR